MSVRDEVKTLELYSGCSDIKIIRRIYGSAEYISGIITLLSLDSDDTDLEEDELSRDYE